MSRRIFGIALVALAGLGAGAPAAVAGPIVCVADKVCVAISVHCPREGGEPGCHCVDYWVNGNHIYQCV